MITTVNFHLIKHCNYECQYCYAKFAEINTKETLKKEEQLQLIEILAESNKFKKINFAGGEPTIIPHLSELIAHAKNKGFITSIITNGSKISCDWIKNNAEKIDILGISVDSISDEINKKIGRKEKNNTTISKEKIQEIACICQKLNIKLKINTVVSSFNKSENLAPFINKLNPFRWKILQVTKIIGQNDTDFEKVKISKEEFTIFCIKNEISHPNIKVIQENDDIIKGSYLMIDPLGRFYDSIGEKYKYSSKILEVGVEDALKDIQLDEEKIKQREAEYEIDNPK